MRVNRAVVRAGIAAAFAAAALVPGAVAAYAQPDHGHANVADDPDAGGELHAKVAGDPDEGGELHARLDAPDPPIIR